MDNSTCEITASSHLFTEKVELLKNTIRVAKESIYFYITNFTKLIKNSKITNPEYSIVKFIYDNYLSTTIK